MTKFTNALAMAAIAIVSATLLAGISSSRDDAYGQQYTAAPPEQNTTSVTGTATTSVTPDLVIIDLGVDTQATTALDALGQNAKEMNSTATAVEKLGITTSEISTSNFSIQPVYNETGPYPPYNQYKSELVGYKVSNTLEIKTGKLGLAGNVLDTAVGAGANRIDSVTFTLSPARLQSVHNSLIAQAVLDAQSKAQQALDQLNEKITGVRSVNLYEFHMAEPVASYGRMAMAVSVPAVQTPVFTSNQDITTSVDVTFLIGAR